MSCPDWRHLRIERAARDADPAGWHEALVHLDGGCPRCRRDALTADPTLVFRRLVPREVVEMTPAQEGAEVAAVRQAVAAMRTASRVGSIGSRARGGLRGRGRWAAAAVLAAAMLSIPADRLWEARHAERAAAPTVARAVPAAFAEPELPTVEGVNRPGARVYNMDGEGMSVVMIVDESLDV